MTQTALVQAAATVIFIFVALYVIVSVPLGIGSPVIEAAFVAAPHSWIRVKFPSINIHPVMHALSHSFPILLFPVHN